MRYARTCCSVVHDRYKRTYTYIGQCIATGQPIEITVPVEAVNAYDNGAMIQDAFPMLTSDERDFLLCGVGPGNMDAFVGGKSRES